MKLKAIAVADKNWGIGKNGGLLIHLPGDLKYFKEKTLGNIVIMGRKTLESLPGAKPLPGRTTIIMTGNKELKGDFYTAGSTEDLFRLLEDLMDKNPDVIPFVAGGESIYSQLLPYTCTFFVTKIDEGFDAEVFLPNLDEDEEFELVEEGLMNTENGVHYKFCEYKRMRNSNCQK